MGQHALAISRSHADETARLDEELMLAIEASQEDTDLALAIAESLKAAEVVPAASLFVSPLCAAALASPTTAVCDFAANPHTDDLDDWSDLPFEAMSEGAAVSLCIATPQATPQASHGACDEDWILVDSDGS